MNISLKSINHASQYILQCLFILTLAILPLMGGCATKINGFTATDVFGNTLEAKLASAAASGDAERVRELVKQGANPNAIGLQKTTPLGWALISNNLDGSEALLQSGANVHQSFGEKIVWTPIFYACLIEDDKFLKLLLNYGANPNQPDEGAFFVPLAAVISDLNKVKILVEAGADVNGGAEYGYEIAKIAESSNDLDVVSYLLEKGYRTNLPLLAWDIKNDDGRYKPEKNVYREQILQQLKKLGVTPPEKRPMSLIRQRALEAQKDKTAK